jgi:hypothetical protein
MRAVRHESCRSQQIEASQVMLGGLEIRIRTMQKLDHTRAHAHQGGKSAHPTASADDHGIMRTCSAESSIRGWILLLFSCVVLDSLLSRMMLEAWTWSGPTLLGLALLASVIT